MAEESKSQAKPWDQPKSGRDVGLHLWNSLTNSKNKFIPAEDNKVSWYICGPTVYDSSHLGHARNYMTFDILRRIMSDYFKYNVFFVMNVTDIDDKIIVRSHFRYLQEINQYFLDNPSKNDFRNSENGKKALEEADLVIKSKKPTIDGIQKATAQLLSAVDKSSEDTPEWLKKDFDIQEEYLKLASYYENEFFDDLESLNIKRPDGITRVSEYVPEIITFIEKIIENGFAYQSGGDVYFDLLEFTKAGFTYNKCSPATLTEAELTSLLAEGEGALSTGTTKKNVQDFALWKTSKPGEPKWASPWGEGRPGWHIECSAMAGDMLGSNVDINCGGVDLRFPHHDNQLAQSEAKFNNKQWVNYFLHTGHLHIGGLKMSKSEKNFITIRSCLQNYSKNQLRFLFLMHKFNAPLDIDLVGGKDNHGKLKIISATLAGVSVINKINSIVGPDDHSFLLQSSQNLFEFFGVSPAAGNLNIQYSLDGEEASEREWEVKEGILQENVEIRAGGRIKQMEEAIQVEKLFNDFFATIRTINRELNQNGSYKWTSEEKKLSDHYQKAKEEIHQSLLDSFNTPKSIEILQLLVKATNSYIKEQALSIKKDLLNSISEYITSILQVFGFSSFNDSTLKSGFQWDGSHPLVSEKILADLLNELCKSRDNIRAAARQKSSAEEIRKLCVSPFKNHSIAQTVNQQLLAVYDSFLENIAKNADKPVEVLSICDRIRDDELPFFGIRLEDSSLLNKNASSWKLDSVQATLRDRENRKLENGSRDRKKRAAAEEKLRQQQEKEKIAQIPVEEFFKQHPTWAGKYASYDETGFPLTTPDGKPLSKGEAKRATTAWTKFKKEKGQK